MCIRDRGRIAGQGAQAQRRDPRVRPCALVAGRVRFAAGQSKRLVVPSSAVLRRGELTAVYVVARSGFVLKAIRLGSDHGDLGVEVLAGLLDSDSVALDPVRAGLAGAQAATPAPSAK